ncbi:alkaline phosphatase family protein [Mesorhizobium caraganae]|uniref:alkaline phosphatase family protein n=1 Tax=Mesorhizobium caraganae TaxID=483206 RepID=UPI003ECFE312
MPLPRRIIVLGFDGMDPGLTRQWMQEGALPNFARVAEIGAYQDLPTTNPAQSPVAWSSFATGLEPGDHGVFDFVTRDPVSYLPKSGLAEETLPPTFDVGGWHLPLGNPQTTNRRSGTPFWITSERKGNRASVLRVPVTYPPDPIRRMLSGLGVPDLLGSQGSFTFYSSDPRDARPNLGSRVVIVRPLDGAVEAVLEGPPHPLRGYPTFLTVPLLMQSDGNSVRISLDGHNLTLAPGQWSDWIAVSFPFAVRLGVTGMVRLNLVQGFPNIKLYVSPIQIDPRDPVTQISAPADFSAELSSRIGPFNTTSFAEETWSLNEELIDDHTYLSMVKSVLAEREAMFFDTLSRNDSELVVTVFEQTDRVSHMFWRGIDPSHPRFKDTTAEGKDAIRWVYGEADRIVGKTLARMGPDERLVILSDHGFAPFRRSAHINRWLANAGLLVTQRPDGGDIDWSRTKAYAMGLNGIFINRRGRESQGVVEDAEAEDIKRRIQSELPLWHDPVNEQPIVLQVYDANRIYHGIHADESPDLVIGYASGYRASWQTALGQVPRDLVEDNLGKWSGDHTIDPSQVPGVLFTNFKPAHPIGSIRDIPTLIRELSVPRGPPAEEAWLKQRATLTTPVAMIAAGLDGWLPLVLQIGGLAALTAGASLAIFRLLANSGRLSALRSASAAARHELVAFDGKLSDLWPLIGRNYRLSALQLGFVFVPTAISVLPAAFMISAVAGVYDHTFPRAGQPVEVRMIAAPGHREPVVAWQGASAISPKKGTWSVPWPAAGESARLLDHDGTALVSLPTVAPTDEIRQVRWPDVFRVVVASLPTPGDIEAVQIAMPTREWIHLGPPWLRYPSAGFIIMLVVSSLLLYWRWRP